MRIVKYITPVFLFLLYSFASNGQNNAIDSLTRVLQTQKEDTNKINTINQLSREYLNVDGRNNALAEDYARQALILSDKLDFLKGKAFAFQTIGSRMELQGKFVEARNKYDSAIQCYEKIGDKNGMADVCGSIASSYFGEQNAPEALNYVYKALKLYEETGNKEGLAFTHMTLASYSIDEKDYHNAIKHLDLANDFFSKTKMDGAVAIINMMLARMHYEQRNYTKALEFDSIALTINTQIGEVYNSGSAYLNRADIFEAIGDDAFSSGISKKSAYQYREAIKNFQSAVDIYKTTNTDEFVFSTYTRLGNIYIKLRQLDSADYYLKKSLDYHLNIAPNLRKPYFGRIEELYLALSKLDSAKGNIAKAYQEYKIYVTYKDSNAAAEKAKRVQQLKMQYDFDKKEGAAKLVQLETEKDQERKRIGQWRVIASLGALILVFLLIMFFQWRNSKHRKQANLLLQQQKEKIGNTLSELRSTQSQLIQSEKMASLGELTAGIAHEIQNPLNFVNNFSDVNTELVDEAKLEMDKGNAEEVKAILNDIKENEQKINHHGKRADAIVKNMLQHSRTSSGQKEPTDINALADEYLRLAYHGLRAKDKSFNATTKTDFDSKIDKINIMSQDIGRVILNLINNAFYAVDEKKKQTGDGYEPTVTVTTIKQMGKVEIKVKDNGKGIPKKVLGKIFQPFFTTKPTGQGTGLGLSLSYDIVKAHGGELKVETKEGEGSEFIIELSNQ